MYCAEALSLRMSDVDTLRGALATVVAMSCAYVLELLAPLSPAWAFVAAAAILLFLFSTSLLSRGVGVAIASSSSVEAPAIVVLGALSLAGCVCFPIIFFAATLCGGDGAGSCLSVADEALYWRVAECGTKLVVTCTVIATTMLTEAVAAANAEPRRRLLVRQLPAKYATSVHRNKSSTVRAVREALPTLLAGPALVGFAALAFLDFVVSTAAGIELDAVSSASLAYVHKYRFVLVAAAAGLAFTMLLNNVARRERVQALASSFLPAGFFDDVEETAGWVSLPRTTLRPPAASATATLATLTRNPTRAPRP